MVIAISLLKDQASTMTGTMVQLWFKVLVVVLYGAGVIGVPWFLFRLGRWEIWNMLRKFDQDVMGGVVR